MPELMLEANRASTGFDKDQKNSAATLPSDVEWRGSRQSKWYYGKHIQQSQDRIQNIPELFTSELISKHCDDLIYMTISPWSKKEGFIWGREGQLQFQEIPTLPSIFQILKDNAVIQEIADPTLSNELIDKFGSALTKLSSLSLLREGWDSYEGRPIEVKALKNVVKFLKILIADNPDIPEPIIGPSPNGAATVQWFLDDLEIFAEIGSTSHAYYIAKPDDEDVTQYGTPTKLYELAAAILTVFK
jgi:hypothetical protein